MTRPWPDEVRAMVDALMRGGACPSVVPFAAGEGWAIYLSGTHAHYVSGEWEYEGKFTKDAAAVLAGLLKQSPLDARYVLRDRIHAAVPSARVTIWSDGIEVTVGSKSVRWKREQRGWSMADDLFTSDDRVVEHAKQYAAEAAEVAEEEAEEIAELAAAEARLNHAGELAVLLKAKGLQTCTLGNLDTGVVTVSAEDAHGQWHTAELREGRWYYGEKELTTAGVACSVLLEAVSRANAAPAPAASRPLIERLREAVPGLEWRDVGGVIKGRDFVWIGTNLGCWVRSNFEPHAVSMRRPSDDEVVRIVSEWYAKTNAEPEVQKPSQRAQALLDALRSEGLEPTYDCSLDNSREYVFCDGKQAYTEAEWGHWRYAGANLHSPAGAMVVAIRRAAIASAGLVRRQGVEPIATPAAPAAPQPSPQAKALLDALRAQGYEPTWEHLCGNTAYEYVLCESEVANIGNGENLWTYLGGQAGTEYVAEQMGLRISRRQESRSTRMRR